MLEVKNIKYQRNDWQCEYNFRLESEQFCLLIGPSGGGKTTLLHLICGFNNPNFGSIILDGVDITNIPPAKKSLSLVFQRHNLFAHLNVADNMALGIRPNLKINKGEMQEIETTLEHVGLTHKINAMPYELSGGEQQRVAIARALIRKHNLLLLDEPFSSLDPPLRIEMIKLIKKIQKINKLSIIMTSHTPSEALGYCDKIMLIDDGKNEAPIMIDHANQTSNITKNYLKYLGDIS